MTPQVKAADTWHVNRTPDVDVIAVGAGCDAFADRSVSLQTGAVSSLNPTRTSAFSVFWLHSGIETVAAFLPFTSSGLIVGAFADAPIFVTCNEWQDAGRTVPGGDYFLEGTTDLLEDQAYLVGLTHTAGDTWSLYLDGVLEATGSPEFGSILYENTSANSPEILGPIDPGATGVFDEYAATTSVLSAGTMANLQAARSSKAAFYNAIEALGPHTWFRCDDLPRNDDVVVNHGSSGIDGHYFSTRPDCAPGLV